MRDVYFSKHYKVVNTESELAEVIQQHDLTVIFNGHRDHVNFHSVIDWSMSRTKIEAEFVVFPKPMNTDSHFSLEWNHVTLYRKQDNRFVPFKTGHYHQRALEEWLYVHSHPPLHRFDQHGRQRLWVDGNPSFVMFVKDSSQETTLLNTISVDGLVDKYHGKILILLCNLEDGSGCSDLTTLCQLEDSDLPRVRVVHVPDSASHPDFVLQYEPEGDLNQPNVEKLIDNFLAGKLDPLVMSESHESTGSSPPAGTVWKLVGSSISAVIDYKNRTEFDLVVLFHRGTEDPESLKAIEWFTEATNRLGTESVRMMSYDFKKNSQLGLSLCTHCAPTVRMYRRQHTHSFVEMHISPDRDMSQILEFVIDMSTDDIYLQIPQQED